MAPHQENVEHIEDEHLQPVNTAELPTTLAENVSYGPSGIKGLIGSPYVLATAFLASMGGFSFGYDQGVISIINVMPQFHRAYPEVDPNTPGSDFNLSVMTAMLTLGAFFGCFFMPWLCDRVSRKYALSVAAAVFNIGTIIQTAAPNYAILVFGRALGGIGTGTLALGAPIYISEIAPPNLRGALLVLQSISIVFGVLFSYWLTFGTRYVDSELSFRLPFGLSMVSAIILGIAILFFPFSPRWLVLRGRNEEALESLAKLRRLSTTDSRVQTEWQGIMAEIEFQKVVQEKTHPGKSGVKLEVLQWLDLFKKKTYRRTIVGTGVAFFQQFSGINAFIYYAPILFQTLGSDYETSLILSGGLNIMQLVAVVICFCIIDHVGRRPLAFWGAAICCIVYIVIAALFGVYGRQKWENSAAGWAAVAFAFLYMLSYGVSYSPLGWALPSEVFTTATRAKGVALSTATVWLSNFFIGIITPPFLTASAFGAFIFFAIWCGLAAVWAWFLVPETKGKTLEEIDELFGDTSGRAEREIMKEARGNARRRSGSAVTIANQARQANEKITQDVREEG